MSELNRKRLWIVAFLAAALATVYFLLPKLFVLFGPFLLAWFFSWVAQPVADFLVKKLRFPKKLAGVITVLLVITLIGGILFMIITHIAGEISSLSDQIPIYYKRITFYSQRLFHRVQGAYIYLPDNVITAVEKFSSQTSEWVGDTLSSWVEPVSRFALSAAGHLPSALIFIIITVLATYFLLNDKALFKDWMKENLPAGLIAHISGVKRELTGALGGYLRAQLILICVTFVELTIGFMILHIKYALLLAIIIAFMDAIPVLGTGTFLIPLAVANFIMDNWVLGVGFLVIYGVCFAVRQLLEPRIIAHEIGLHPLVTLIFIYLGLKLFGFIGMILGPSIALIIRYFYLGGVFYPLLPLPKNKREESSHDEDAQPLSE